MLDEHYLGHRARLKERFRVAPTALTDYEILELALGYVIRRGDVKPQAKSVIEKIGGMRNLFTAKVADVKGVGAETDFFIKLLRELVTRVEFDNIDKDDMKLTNASLLFNYLKYKIGLSDKEEFLLVSLNVRYKLIAVDVMSKGTVNQTVVFIREVVEKAIERKAAKVIITHNHPSGEYEPSASDDIVTSKVADALKLMDIEMVDHVIITSNDFYSYRKAKKNI